MTTVSANAPPPLCRVICDVHIFFFYYLIIVAMLVTTLPVADAAIPYRSFDTPAFLEAFPEHTAKAYAVVSDHASIRDSCAQLPHITNAPEHAVVLDVGATGSNSSGTGTALTASQVQAQCGMDTVCVVPAGISLTMDAPLIVHALVLRGGALLWNAQTQAQNSVVWLCAGYVAVEEGGLLHVDFSDIDIDGGDGYNNATAFIYLRDNGATHAVLRTRVLGAVGSFHNVTNTGNSSSSGSSAAVQQPTIRVLGRPLRRTWSLLAAPLNAGNASLQLVHDPIAMGWRIGDRIAVAPTDVRSEGEAQSFTIASFSDGNTVQLNAPSVYDHEGRAWRSASGHAAFLSAEVINLSRNVVITGDDFTEVACDANLTEAYPNFGTSTWGCMCTPTRQSCTVGLHTVHMYGGSSEIANARVEKCGQRGIEGKYCFHLHQIGDCPGCLYQNNAVEYSMQRGLIVHGTHRATADSNVFYNVRGANVYVEDGNEILNRFAYNVAICPWIFEEGGCTLPGTSNEQADTSLNQAGLYLTSPTNDLIGNRMANHFNGMFLNAEGGRGPVYGKVCSNRMPLGRYEGNTYHSSGRFGTYALNDNFPVQNTGTSIASNGETGDCEAFTADGGDNGLSLAIWNNFDYGNAFVGYYAAGDIQYNGHSSFQNLNVMYWKETKSFVDGCSAHVTNSYFANGTMALPDTLGSFIIEHTTLENVLMEANHHCGIGVTGLLCMPHYVLHNVTWNNLQNRSQWVAFTQSNDAGMGGIFSLSPPDVARNTESSASTFFLPPSYASLVSGLFVYLVDTGFCDTTSGLGLGERYDNGILCRSPLQTLRIYSDGVGSGPNLSVQVFRSSDNQLLATQEITFYHHDGAKKEGYSLPVIPDNRLTYRISLVGNVTIPNEWIIDFGDGTLTNRWGVETLHVDILGRNCSATGVRSDHDRLYLTTADANTDLGWGHGACTVNHTSSSTVKSCLTAIEPSRIEQDQCPGACSDCGSGGYCDCMEQQCKCRPGRYGDACALDVCASSNCGERGACASRYLGSDLPVSIRPCVCDEGWAGLTCRRQGSSNQSSAVPSTLTPTARSPSPSSPMPVPSSSKPEAPSLQGDPRATNQSSSQSTSAASLSVSTTRRMTCTFLLLMAWALSE